MIVKKRVLLPDRRRRLPSRGWSWIDRRFLREYADWTSPVYRRKRVPLGDLIALCEGLRVALPTVLAPGEADAAGPALDQAVTTYRWHRRLAGDARRKNAFLQFIYKGG